MNYGDWLRKVSCDRCYSEYICGHHSRLPKHNPKNHGICPFCHAVVFRTKEDK